MAGIHLLWQDIRCSALSLFGRPGLAIGVVLSLSLSIGMTATVFSLIEDTLVQPIPALPRADRVLIVGSSTGSRGEPNGYLSYLQSEELASQAESFSQAAAFATFDVNLEKRGIIETVRAAAVSRSYFSVVGSAPSEGALSWSEEQAAQPVAVIGHGLRQRLFSQDQAAPGLALTLNGIRFEIIGVASQGFRGVDRVNPIEVWVPLEAFASLASGPSAALGGKFDRRQQWLHLVGRLRPDSSPELAQRELSLLAERLARHGPDADSDETIVGVTAQEFAFGPGGRQRLQTYLSILVLMTSLALLISFGTVASLLLAAGLGREEEFAIRLCLGAGRAHLVKLLLLEGMILAIVGGVGGVALATAALPAMKQVRLPTQAAVSPELNLPVVAFALLTAVLVSLLASLLPALRLAKSNGLAGNRKRFTRKGWLGRVAAVDFLVVAHMAAAFVLLVGAGLFLRTLHKLESVDPGFARDELIVFDLDIGFLDASPANSAGVYHEVLTAIEGVLGVERASLAGGLPIFGGTLDLRLSMTADTVEAGNEDLAITYALVSPGYFKTVGTPILRGREFSARDTAGAPLVAILDETLARKYPISGDPVGVHIRLAQGEGPFEVVGLAGSITPADSRETDTPVLYLAYPQWQSSFVGGLMASSMSVVVRTGGDPSTVIPGIRRAIQSADDRLPPVEIATVESRLAELAAIERQAGGLFSALGGVSHGLALLGLYALMTRAVLHRRKELAIRMAVGAGPGAVLRQVLRRGLGLTVAAMALGFPAAWALGKIAKGHLYGVSSGDPVTFVLVAVCQTGFTLFTALVPAWRATRIDVCDGLRSTR